MFTLAFSGLVRSNCLIWNSLSKSLKNSDMLTPCLSNSKLYIQNQICALLIIVFAIIKALTINFTKSYLLSEPFNFENRNKTIDQNFKTVQLSQKQNGKNAFN